MTNDTDFLSQERDFMGSLQADLRGLGGIATMASELIQNADDVKDEHGEPGGATLIFFDVRDDALHVYDDGRFSDCGCVKQPTCPWSETKGKLCDFHRIRLVAGADKRREGGTTGSFGIGFNSVYQITDHPEIKSNGQHWRFWPERPSHQRIEVLQGDSQDGTEIILPWAFDPASEVRRRLLVPALSRDSIPAIRDEIAGALSITALFPQHLKTLELRRRGRRIICIKREESRETLVLTIDRGSGAEEKQIWHLFRSTIRDEDKLRSLYPAEIEDKRRSEVVVAVPDQPSEAKWQLFAVLPTSNTIPLPLHINADFFPSSDRQRVPFGNGPQGEWNRAAIAAAATALSGSLDRLVELVGAKRLWSLLEQIAAQAKHPVFGAFWSEAERKLPRHKIVENSRGYRTTPATLCIPISEAEKKALPALEALYVSVVHPDLWPYQNLLLKVGVPRLSVDDLIEELKHAGLAKAVAIEDAPEHLQKPEEWEPLWQALDELLRAQSAAERERSIGNLSRYAIAFDSEGYLRPPINMYRADARTRALFGIAQVAWLAEPFDPERMPARLVPPFTPSVAVARLQQHGPIRLLEAYGKGELDLGQLYTWFESHKEAILHSLDLTRRLCDLPIWPTQGQLQTLDGLFIPCGFEDPLRQTKLIDLEVFGNRKEFLITLGVPELTFEKYVRDYMPQVVAQQPDITVSDLRKLAQLLSKHLSEIYGDQALRNRLRALPLVECADGQFRPGPQVYADQAIHRIVGASLPIAAPTTASGASVLLLDWLGVIHEPRPQHVLDQVRRLAAAPPNKESIECVAAILDYLASRWQAWDQVHQKLFSPLKDLAWLPGCGYPDQWFRPRELHATFERRLFESQATFFGIEDYQLEQRMSGSGLMDSLEMEASPTPFLIVGHLRLCSKEKRQIESRTIAEIYTRLTNRITDALAEQLRQFECLLLDQGRYVHPDCVFWGEHLFGPYRDQLSSEWRPYSELLEALGVRETPQAKDYIDVLTEICKDAGHSGEPLAKQQYDIVMLCWKGLSQGLAAGTITTEQLDPLRGKEVIPNALGKPKKPVHLLFEDRAGMAEKFPDFYEETVIKRSEGAWPAMEAVGVRRFSQVVQPDILEAPSAADEEALAKHIAVRQSLLARVLDPEQHAGPLDRDALSRLHFCSASELLIRYSLRVMQPDRDPTDPEHVPAIYDAAEERLIAVYEDGQPVWPAVAREIAYALRPGGEIGGLASRLNDALAYGSFDEASAALDLLGYPPLQGGPSDDEVEQRPKAGIGGSEEPVAQALAGGPETTLTATPAIHPVEPATSDTPAATTEAIRSNGAVPAQQGGNAGSAQVQSEIQPPPGGYPSPTVGPAKAGTEGATGSPKPKSARRTGSGRGRLRSYKLPEGYEPTSKPDPAAAKHRTEVDIAGIEFVCQYERVHGRIPDPQEHDNEGFDIKSVDKDGCIMYIEVKSLGGNWDSYDAASLSHTQFEMAQQYGESYWLYVVERAKSSPRVYRIKNPASRIDQHLFDDGWRCMDEPETQA